MLNAWRLAVGATGSANTELPEDQGIAIARRLGARRLVLGGVVGTPGGIVLNAIAKKIDNQYEQPGQFINFRDSQKF